MKQLIKTFGSIIAISTLMIIAASCTKDELSEEVQQRNPGVETYITVNAGLPENENSDKAYLDYAASRKVKWNNGDAININGSNLTENNISSDGMSARFAGTTHAIQSSSNRVYWAVHPTTLCGSYTNSIPSDFTANELTVSLPSVQVYDYNEEQKLTRYSYMAAYISEPSNSTDICFQMHNLGSVLRLTLKADANSSNKKAEKIVFTSDDKLLSGTFKTNPNFTSLSGQSASAQNYLTVQLKSGSTNFINLETEKIVYVVLPPFASKQLTMRIYNTDGNFVTKSVESTTMQRNHIYNTSLNNIKFNESWYYVAGMGDTVLFSPGNLQWSATNGGSSTTTHRTSDGTNAAGTWRFATKQWHCMRANNNNISDTYRGWIDLFGWATSGWHASNDTYVVNYMPYSSSNATVDATMNYYGYGPSKNQVRNLTGGSSRYDWGVYNYIYNPQTGRTDAAGTWFCPSKAEWEYLLFTRATATRVNGNPNARWTLVSIDTNSSHGYTYNSSTSIRAMLLFPDNGGRFFIMNGTGAFGKINEYGGATTLSYSDWMDWEKMGATLLPAAGRRSGTTYVADEENGFYWTTTHLADDDVRNATDFYFNRGIEGNLNVDDAVTAMGRSVRLVKRYVR